MTRIDVATPSRPYGVTIEANATDRLAAILDEIGAPARRFVVSSPLVTSKKLPLDMRQIPETRHPPRKRPNVSGVA